jgi:hypothetical protein
MSDTLKILFGIILTILVIGVSFMAFYFYTKISSMETDTKTKDEVLDEISRRVQNNDKSVLPGILKAIDVLNEEFEGVRNFVSDQENFNDYIEDHEETLRKLLQKIATKEENIEVPNKFDYKPETPPQDKRKRKRTNLNPTYVQHQHLEHEKPLRGNFNKIFSN